MRSILYRIYQKTVFENPFFCLIFLLVFGVYIQTGLKNFKLDASIDALILESDPDLSLFRDLISEYETKEFIFVAIEHNEDFLSLNSRNLATNLVEDIRKISGVSDVVSVMDVPLVFNDPNMTLAGLASNFKTLRMENINLERARDELTSSPFYKDLVVNGKGTVSSIAVYLTPHLEFFKTRDKRNKLLNLKQLGKLDLNQNEEFKSINRNYDIAKAEAIKITRETLAQVRDVIDKYQSQTSSKLYIGGLPLIVDDVTKYIKGDLVNFGGGVLFFLILMLSLIFREVRWVILPLASCIYAGVTMLGFLGLIGWKVTVISSNFIALMLIITMSMNVHLIVRYRELNNQLPDHTQKDLVSLTVQKMARPCIYTAITTIIAFLSLLMADIKPVIDFGLMMTLGLTVVYATTFLLFPSLLVLTKKTTSKSSGGLGSFVKLTTILGNFTEKKPKTIFILAFILLIFGISGINRLQVENSFVSYFDKETDIYEGLSLIDSELGGTTPFDIVLSFKNEDNFFDNEFKEEGLADLFDDLNDDCGTSCSKEETWFTQKKIETIAAVHSYLEEQKEIGKVMSLESTIRVAEKVKGEPLEPFEMNIANQRLPALVKSQIIDPYVSFPRNQARITTRIIDTYEGLERKELLTRIEKELQTKIGLDKEEFEVSGLLVLYNNVLQSLFTSQILTLGFVMAGILFTMMILFKSITVAFIGLIPNILAAATILGFMGWMNIPLDIMTITIAAITVGIAVDNCIHYLYRFRAELPNNIDPIKNMHYCHNNIAHALFYTTVTIVFGFSILTLSNFIPTILFGILTALAMILALLGALTLMPLLIIKMKPFKKAT